MDRLAFSAVAAIKEQAVTRQMSTNELANVSTLGFKRSFEAASIAIAVQGPGLQSRTQPQALTSDFISLTPGARMATGRDMDVVFDGQTVLGVTAPDGQLAFTRRGDLRVNAQGALETGSGHLVRGQTGGGITLPPGLVVSIQSDGSVFGTDPGQVGPATSVLLGQLLMRETSDIQLQRRVDGLFKPVGLAEGQDIGPSRTPPSLTSGALEGSNVNAMQVMVRLMDQSRTFEQLVNLIKESKTTDESGSTMMRPN